jgi:hypothetical protein
VLSSGEEEVVGFAHGLPVRAALVGLYNAPLLRLRPAFTGCPSILGVVSRSSVRLGMPTGAGGSARRTPEAYVHCEVSALSLPMPGGCITV